MSSEAEAIASTDVPATVHSLTTELRSLGLTDGDTVMVHASLSALGFVVGGAQAVVAALLDVVGPSGTLMMPTHSGALSDPSLWEAPPVPAAWWDTVRAHMPPFDAAMTPTRGMGAVVECFRHVDGVQRSSHPSVSAAAVGPNAHALVGDHSLDDGLGEGSPQARLYDFDGLVLLLGVSHANNTSLHLSEYRSADADAPRLTEHAPILIDGEQRWQAYTSLETDEDDFESLGEAFAASGAETIGSVGAGTGRLMSVRAVVDFGVQWMRMNRVRPGDL